MIPLIARVVRNEGLASAYRRAAERVAEAMHRRWMLARPARPVRIPILNVSMMGLSPRAGGVQTQLLFRMREERKLRDVALFTPGYLEMPTFARRVHRVGDALRITGAKTLHLEGTFGVSADDVMHDGVELVVSVHDDSATPELLRSARKIVYPSRFLRDQYGLDGEIIEPGIPRSGVRAGGGNVAFAGAILRHKGAHLLPELAELVPDVEWHAFGGGDLPLPKSIRRHGYYRAGTLAALLKRHRIGRVVLPSIVEESFSLVLSECWQAGVPVVAFDQGALGERIREHGGGGLAPRDSGAAGLATVLRGDLPPVPGDVPTSVDAAEAYVALYRRCRMLAVSS